MLILPISGSAGIECRTGGPNGNHKVIISFANNISVGGASVASSDGQAMVSSFSVNGAAGDRKPDEASERTDSHDYPYQRERRAEYR
jgi:hypothetical protein